MATTFNRAQASDRAIELVKAALESGVIKLNGPMGAGGPESYAGNDAKYLAKLVNDLAENIKSPDQK
jgi:hypothetical protein